MLLFFGDSASGGCFDMFAYFGEGQECFCSGLLVVARTSDKINVPLFSEKIISVK